MGFEIIKSDVTPIGWREWIELPDLSRTKIKAKVDTGAKTSALHAFDVVMKEKRNKTWVEFKICPMQHQSTPSYHVEAEVIDLRKVKSSSGHVTVRPVIMTRLKIGKIEKIIELNLVNRDVMGFRMIIGREALKGAFIVNVARSFLLGKKKKKGLKK